MASKLALLFFTLSFLLSLSSLLHSISAHDLNASPFHSVIKSIKGSKKGETVKGISTLKNYLHRFGYLSYADSKNDAVLANDDYFDEVTESAVKLYQKNYNLNPTGILDEPFVKLLSQPRCGVPDDVTGQITSNQKYCYGNSTCIQLGSRYAFFNGNFKWPAEKSVLTYGFEPGTRPDVMDPIAQATAKWAAVSHFKFNKVDDVTQADIKISFQRGDHGDGSPFDGPRGVTAHAFAPTDGRLHYDGDENWVVGAVAGAMDMGSIGLHELGHVLGLAHSTVGDAVMFAFLSQGVVKDVLTDDDIQGIKALYNE